MAQREKEETELKVPETLNLCINNCGFSGNPATNNMCQKCFQKATILSSPSCSGREKPKSPPIWLSEGASPGGSVRTKPSQGPETPAPVRQINRCYCCRKNVGLTGYRCRCGELFCAKHRYSDRHDCSYDYKTAGREAIARENPVVKAAKIVRL